MNSTLTGYKYNKIFIYLDSIAVLTSCLCIPIYSFTLKFYKWIKNKYFNNNLNLVII